MPNRPFVVGIDFDGTLAQYKGGAGLKPPLLPIPGSQELVLRLKALGCIVVIWTCRHQPHTITEWCREHGIPFDAINHNPLFERKGDGNEGPYSQKIFCDVYYDDRGMHCPGNHDGAFEEIMRRRQQWLDNDGHGDT